MCVVLPMLVPQLRLRSQDEEERLEESSASGVSPSSTDRALYVSHFNVIVESSLVICCFETTSTQSLTSEG